MSRETRARKRSEVFKAANPAVAVASDIQPEQVMPPARKRSAAAPLAAAPDAQRVRPATEADIVGPKACSDNTSALINSNALVQNPVRSNLPCFSYLF